MIPAQERVMKTHMNLGRNFSFGIYFYYPSYRREARAPEVGQAA